VPLLDEPPIILLRFGPGAVDSPEVRILIVEDSPEVEETLRPVLLEDGHEVQVADNGAAGLELARPSSLRSFCSMWSFLRSMVLRSAGGCGDLPTPTSSC
jgi:hypothetical protein